ncbi:hypothetical protein B0H17DRAFT_1211105 [Mycena rosella]|uniref:Uncharacterized protein n=1 Tax=Mycena rosella TaxID=1033263 RepID=A0AAD7CUR1_MYCRO|nr:hypothetical protein B0H17DRAFT_1211105 [Mycena rosella]
MSSLPPACLSKSDELVIRTLLKVVRNTKFSDPVDQDIFLVKSAHTILKYRSYASCFAVTPELRDCVFMVHSMMHQNRARLGTPPNATFLDLQNFLGDITRRRHHIQERERANADRARVVEGMAARIARNVALEYTNKSNNQPASPNDDTVSIPSSSDESGADGPERTLPIPPASPIKVDKASAHPSSQATPLSPLYELEAHLRRLSMSAPHQAPPNSPLSSDQSLPDLVPDFTLGQRPVRGDGWKRGRTPVKTPQSQPRMHPTQGPAVQCHMLRMVPRPFGLPLPYQKASSVGDWLQSKQKFADSPRPRKNSSGNSKQFGNRGRSTPRPSPKKIKRCYYCTAADHLVALCPLREPID